MKVALVHDWLTGMRGGEKVLEVFCELFPEATLFTLFHHPGSVSDTIESMEIRTSFLQHIPLLPSRYRYALPLFPYAVESFDLLDYDLVISSSHCVALGVITKPHTCHICYCFTPIRYAWDMYRDYFAQGTRVRRMLISYFLNRLRMWDVAASHRVDQFVAISQHVARRINKFYRRRAEVIFPPVENHYFNVKPNPEAIEHVIPGEYFLVVSALSPYKRLDLAIEACNRLNHQLVIIGTGPLYQKLKQQAGPTVHFLGWQSDEMVAQYYAQCKAFLFCGEEDFGITVLEANACGKPVIAFRAGGACETIVEGLNGTFFEAQTVDQLSAKIAKFRISDYNEQKIRERARQFHRERFKDLIAQRFDEMYRAFRSGENYKC